jgi:hypothetical protein
VKTLLKVTAVFCASALAFSITTSANIILYEFNLTGAEEVPPVTTPATGFASVTLNTATNLLTWDISFQDLTNGLSGAHFHGPAAFGSNAGVLVGMTLGDASGQTSGSIIGSTTISETIKGHILDGNTYINLHSFADPDPNVGFPGGELRGQVIPEPGTYALFAGFFALLGAGYLRRRRR